MYTAAEQLRFIRNKLSESAAEIIASNLYCNEKSGTDVAEHVASVLLSEVILVERKLQNETTRGSDYEIRG